MRLEMEEVCHYYAYTLCKWREKEEEERQPLHLPEAKPHNKRRERGESLSRPIRDIARGRGEGQKNGTAATHFAPGKEAFFLVRHHKLGRV